MDSDRIKEIQEETAYPQSISVYKALLKVWNECQQEHNEQLSTHDVNSSSISKFNDDSPIGKTEEKNYEEFKREVITIISDDGLITPNQTLDDYRNKLKLIIDVL